jgi:hypothetical protein
LKIQLTQVQYMNKVISVKKKLNIKRKK